MSDEGFGARLMWMRKIALGGFSERAVLSCLIDHSDDEWGTFVGQATIAAECGGTVRTVGEVLRRWESEGKIVRRKRFRSDGVRTSDYTTIVAEAWALRPEGEEPREEEPREEEPREEEPREESSDGEQIEVDHRKKTASTTGSNFQVTPSSNPQRSISARGGTGNARGTPHKRSPSPKDIETTTNDQRPPRAEDLNATPSSAVGVAETWTDRAGVRIRGIPRGSSLALVVADIAAETGCEIHELGAAIDWAFARSGNAWYAKRLVNVAGLRELAGEIVVVHRQSAANGLDEYGCDASTRAWCEQIGLDPAIYAKIYRGEELDDAERSALEAVDERLVASERSAPR